jgi:hypothetical protein
MSLSFYTAHNVQPAYGRAVERKTNRLYQTSTMTALFMPSMTTRRRWPNCSSTAIAERGSAVADTAILRWVQRLVPAEVAS